MKKLISTMAATALIATSSFAFDPAKDLDLSKVYVGAGLAMETITDFDAGFALVLNAGLPVKETGNNVIGAEVELTQTLSAAERTITTTASMEASLTTMAIYSTYTYNVNKSLFAKVRAGFLYESITMELGSLSSDDSQSGVAFGLHTGYNINETMGVYLGYDFIEADVQHITLGMNYHF